MIRKIAKPWTEVQLGFTFLADGDDDLSIVRKREINKPHKIREARPKSQGLAEVFSLAQAQLLDAPLDEVSSQLLSLFELCEATLTRALDVITLRETEPLLSVEEQRSLRGIGQAQWLLTEKLARHGARAEEKRIRKKKMMSDEQ